MTRFPTAILAEDEPLLTKALRKRLHEQWPELTIVGEPTDGISATVMALQDTPDILFLDIAMPGRNGIEVAKAVIGDWPEGIDQPLIVFVTAFDEFAIDAFECEAVDFLQKPVTRERLSKTVSRLKSRLSNRSSADIQAGLQALLQSLNASRTSSTRTKEHLAVLQVGFGNTIHMVRVQDVLYFESSDKYVNVVTADNEGLIRISMRELMSRIDGSLFMQVHRRLVVNKDFIASAHRDEDGHVSLRLHGTNKIVQVSRAYAHLFRPM
ncbi:LytTR family DNA-binding domain-containing protein [Noviherbaspirillum sp.]|jgi:DNA-binding LytR/AlgR family response regulator|uniref:LytR/AlgR family response regulator transcription factor n=1 Tax=Noviherbaspirillum sp. TaxID=1926288 RepID=UPI0025E847E7|nr:LytTR family DNA-binding domain-containing protein [Noviherbaspirillum sp.]